MIKCFYKVSFTDTNLNTTFHRVCPVFDHRCWLYCKEGRLEKVRDTVHVMLYGRLCSLCWWWHSEMGASTEPTPYIFIFLILMWYVFPEGTKIRVLAQAMSLYGQNQLALLYMLLSLEKTSEWRFANVWIGPHFKNSECTVRKISFQTNE